MIEIKPNTEFFYDPADKMVRSRRRDYVTREFHRDHMDGQNLIPAADEKIANSIICCLQHAYAEGRRELLDDLVNIRRSLSHT